MEVVELLEEEGRTLILILLETLDLGTCRRGPWLELRG